MAKKYLDFEGLSHFKGKLDVVLAAIDERLVEMYYTKGEVDVLIDDLQFGIMKKVDALPVVGEEHIIYLVPKEAPATGFDEWLWVADEEEYELIGDTNIDLSDYYRKSEVDTLVNTEKTRAQGVEQSLQNEILGQTGAIQTAISNANAATAAANTAATAANNVNATLNTTTNVVTITDRTGTSKSIDLTNHTNVELEGSVITVTNKNGDESEIDLLNATSERASIHVSTNKDGVTIQDLIDEGIIESFAINVFYNGDTSPSVPPLELDENGCCTLVVPRTYNVKLTFPTIAGFDPITDITYQAHASQRIVDVEYKETFIPTHGENVLVILQEKRGENFVKVPNKVVTVTYNGRSTDYTTDAEGKIIDIIIPFNTQYTITYPKIEGYYIRGGAKYTFEYTAEKSNRSCIMTYFSFQSGVFIVSDEGYSYNLQEWIDSGLPDSKAVAIKIATTNLQDNGGVFAVDIDFITNTGPSNLPLLKWAGSETLFTSIPTNGGTSTSNFFYDGLTTSELIINEGILRGISTPAFNRAKQYTLTVDGETYNGFIGSRGQWMILWNLIAEINDILTTVRPDGEYRLNNYGGVQKWNAGQNGAASGLLWGQSASMYSKRNDRAVFPFFKINE